jgi:Na+-transporting methylmalonyl-CoA/oxaloacetate decarboxylase gamma subunit
MDQLIIGNFNALSFSLFGISVVFVGLSLIAIYIKILPIILETLELTQKNKKDEKVKLSEQEIEEEELAAIMVAFRLHNMNEIDDQRITWARHQGAKSTWDISRRAENLRGGK